MYPFVAQANFVDGGYTSCTGEADATTMKAAPRWPSLCNNRAQQCKPTWSLCRELRYCCDTMTHGQADI